MELKNRKLHLYYTVLGLERMLEECCSGRNVHRIANLRTALRSWRQLVTREEATHEQIAKIEALLPELSEEVKQHYRIYRGARAPKEDLSMNSLRMERLQEYSRRPPYSTWMKQVGARGIILISSFIRSNDHLDRNQFAEKVNRMFLGNPVKPKNWTLIDQLLMNVNSAMPEPLPKERGVPHES